MRQKLVNRISFFIFIPLLFSCNSTPLTIEDHESMIELNKGEAIAVVLESTKQTEYVWELVNIDDSIVSLVNGPVFNTKKQLDTEVMEYLYTFKAISSGESNIKLLLHDPDYPEKQAKQDFILHIQVLE